MIVAGYSAYSRNIDFKRFREIADSVGAFLMADIAHPAGLIAKGLLNDPIPHCHFVTTTTHKTLRGPRGGMIMMGKDFENPFGLKTPKGEIRSMSSLIDLSVFPGNQGGPLEHVIAAKAVSFGEALSDEFLHYAIQVQKNAKKIAQLLVEKGYNIVKEAETALVKADITANKNMVPFDDKSPFVTSGIRLGTAAVTTRGLKEADMEVVAGYIDEVINNAKDEKLLEAVAQKVNQFMKERPLFNY